MLMITETETVALRLCSACGAELLDRDKFCRRCGVRHANSYATSTDLARSSGCETRALPPGEKGCQSFSGQLIEIVAQSVAARVAVPGTQPRMKRLVCALITIPIWMLIVMLSPLDAITAARAAAGYTTAAD